jgi:MFS family permease
LAPTFVGGFSDSAGRRPAYIVCFVIYILANIGLAIQHNYAALLILRCVQSSGSSGTVALATAVAADLVTSAERGSYIGYASVASILAPSLAPVIGGLISQYLGTSWIFWFLVIFAAAFFLPFLLFFPETCRKIVGNGSIPPPELNHSLPSYLRERRLKKMGRYAEFEKRDELAKGRHLRFPNPLSTLKIIFTKSAGLILVTNAILFSCYYMVSASLPSQFQLHYGLNDVQISLIFLPLGVGSLLSAFSTGFLVDLNYRRHAKRLGMPVEKNKQQDLSNYPIERARLEVALPLLILGAVGIIAYGWMVERRTNIAGPCVALFVVGYAIVAGFNCMSILMIDMYPGKAGTATAANNLVRCLLGAAASAVVIPLADAIGVGWTCTLSSCIWAGFSTPLIFILIKFGPRWRAETKARKEEGDKVKEERREAKEADLRLADEKKA